MREVGVRACLAVSELRVVFGNKEREAKNELVRFLSRQDMQTDTRGKKMDRTSRKCVVDNYFVMNKDFQERQKQPSDFAKEEWGGSTSSLGQALCLK